jgi:hypothetical protein
MLNKIMIFAVSVVFCVGPEVLARDPGCPKYCGGRLNQKRLAREKLAREQEEQRKQALLQQNQAAPAPGKAGQGEQGRDGQHQQLLAQVEKIVEEAIKHGKHKEAVALIMDMLQKKQLSEQEVEILIQKFGLEKTVQQVMQQGGQNNGFGIKNVIKAVLTNPIRLLLGVAGTLAAIGTICKLSVAIKPLIATSWEQIRNIVSYDNAQAGKIVKMSGAITTVKALGALVKNSLSNTCVGKAILGCKKFAKDAMTIIKQGGIPQSNVVLCHIDKPRVIWEVVKGCGMKLINLLAGLEQPAGRVMTGVGV